MNIFATDLNPGISAKALDDKRLIKMILESAQLMSTAINVCGGQGPYKTTHVNHPCSIWCRENAENYQWLLLHFQSLCFEYSSRFHKIHKCHDHIKKFIDGASLIPYSETCTPHPNCTIYKERKETYQAYRDYLNWKWDNDKRVPKWTNAEPPKWRRKCA